MVGGVIREATLLQRQRVPDIGIFQALGFDSYSVRAGDGAFFGRIAPGRSASNQPTPARSGYPNCFSTS